MRNLAVNEDGRLSEIYERWFDFLEDKLIFWNKASRLHNKEHCARVLLLVLRLGAAAGLTDDEFEILAQAAVFHDSRRLDDGQDKGHGARAAAYYHAWCRARGCKFSRAVYYAVYYHDQPDSMGLRRIATAAKQQTEKYSVFYRLLKDADALDRFRLGVGGLDVCYLRTAAAKDNVEYARLLWEASATKRK